MSNPTPDVSYRTGKVEVLVRPLPYEPGVFFVLLRDGTSQITTCQGDYLVADVHARYLFSIIETAVKNAKESAT